jgi:hypothetical protein
VPVAYAGEPGAFAEDAVLAAFGDVERASLGAFREVFEAVAHGDASAGVVPIENVINGTVRENYDLLLEFDLVIRGEVVVPVSLCLAALPGQRIDDIERVYSHIQALGQAEAFLRTWPHRQVIGRFHLGRPLDRDDEKAPPSFQLLRAILTGRPRALGSASLPALFDGRSRVRSTPFTICAPVAPVHAVGPPIVSRADGPAAGRAP